VGGNQFLLDISPIHNLSSFLLAKMSFTIFGVIVSTTGLVRFLPIFLFG
jgi:hypothetical protein